MPQTHRCHTVARGSAFPGDAVRRHGVGWLPGLLLAAAVLVAPGLAAAQADPPATVAAAPDASAMVPARRPRPGSGAEPGHAGAGQSGRRTAEQRFEEANTSHDGHLTQAQAEAAHMRGVGSHFAEIDKGHRGYVTLEEIRAWRAERRAERKAEREKAAK